MRLLLCRMPVPVHQHPVECVILARSRIRAIRAKLRLNRAIVEAYEEYEREMDSVVDYLESRITRVDPRDLVYLTPPPLERQQGDFLTPPPNRNNETN